MSKRRPEPDYTTLFIDIGLYVGIGLTIFVMIQIVTSH